MKIMNNAAIVDVKILAKMGAKFLTFTMPKTDGRCSLRAATNINRPEANNDPLLEPKVDMATNTGINQGTAGITRDAHVMATAGDEMTSCIDITVK